MILGVSPDPPAKHRKFKAKYELPFTLIADTDHRVAEAYGVWVEKNMMGRKYMGIARTTFVIDRVGRIAKVFEKVNPLGHAKEVAEAIEELRAHA